MKTEICKQGHTRQEMIDYANKMRPSFVAEMPEDVQIIECPIDGSEIERSES